VEIKILINQFLTQDGLFSQYNVDDVLIAKAETPGDQFEYMGIANPSSGSFFAKPPLVNFSKRLKNALGGDPIDEITVAKAGLPAFSPPIPVDINVPFILTELNIPIASWHQKLVTIDGKVALVGGMNLQGDDWDSSKHSLYEPRRMDFGASVAAREAVAAKEQLPDYPPAKDYMIRIQGPVAADVEGLFAALWQYQLENGVLYADLSTPAVTHPLPEPIVPGNSVVQAQLLMTLPAPFHRYSVLEALERAIARAQSYIFIEDQYLRSPRLTLALKTRMMAVSNLKLIVVTSPINAWTDPGCWQTHVENEILHGLFPSRFRTYQLKSFDAVDTNCTFCVDEVLATFQNHYLHSKLVIIDDLFLEVGSANHNNRSMLYDAELAVAVFDTQWVRSEREKVTKEILGNYYKGEMTPDQLFEKFEKAAAANQSIYELWEADDFDKNLNGAEVPSYLKPRGFLYPLSFGTPEYCTFENVSGDIM
jgi:phosphatidylserine/phosphatidylglycerophosphate/cardiolipin synthase-like enzyme